MISVADHPVVTVPSGDFLTFSYASLLCSCSIFLTIGETTHWGDTGLSLVATGYLASEAPGAPGLSPSGVREAPCVILKGPYQCQVGL